MDYTEITIEGDKVTMSAEAFAKIESREDKLEDEVFQCFLKITEAREAFKEESRSLGNVIHELQVELNEAKRKVKMYEAFAKYGYVVFSYTSTDCDNTTSNGWLKCYSFEQVDGAIDGLYEDAEGSVGYEIITENLEEFKGESDRYTYGGVWY
jgi:hypothetical protein